MQKLAMECELGDAYFSHEMHTLGLLHDIGYAYTDNIKKHNVCGGELLKSWGYKYWKEVYYHGCVKPNYKSSALDLLNEADMLVDSNGNFVTISERLLDVGKRYGKESSQYKDLKALAKRMNLI